MENMYVALDFPNGKQAKAFLHDNDLHGIPVKVGMELFYREGPEIIYQLKRQAHPIFLDLKLHDIPQTVMNTMKHLATLEIDMVNVHATGGLEMIKYAKEGLLKGSLSHVPPKLIAVTILTSMKEDTLKQTLKIQDPLEKYTGHLARLSQMSNADGVVCSVHEVNHIKRVCGSHFLTVTPGIRLQGEDFDDQRRVSTPTKARKQGADVLIVGRSVTKATRPKEAYEQMVKERKEIDESRSC